MTVNPTALGVAVRKDRAADAREAEAARLRAEAAALRAQYRSENADAITSV